MGATVMMYVLPMLLGQTYDLGKDKPGLPIYPTNIQDDAVKIERYFTDSQYRMVENAAQMKDFLDVTGKLSLKIKSGLLDISGEGRYLKDSSSKSNSLEILVKLHFETVTFTIPTSKKPNADWTTFPSQFLGTHYCRSITYGGDLVASIRISGSDRYDLERIKGAISAGVKTSGGSFEGDIKGKLEILKQNAQDSSSMEIDYYASVPIQGVSYNIDGLLKLVDDFPDHVKKVNKGLGNPLRMELYPLSSLKDGFNEYIESRALSDELDDLESQFDDLRETRRQLGAWITQLPPAVTDTVQKRIDKFANRLNSVYEVYMKTISELNVAQGASTKPIEDAFKAYKGEDYMLPQKYVRAFWILQRTIYIEAPELQPKFGGAQYIHWGRSECGYSDAKTSVSGVSVASISSSDVDGASSDFMCSPLDPELQNPEDYFPNYKLTTQSQYSPRLSPIQYKGSMGRFRTLSGKTFACAHCRVGPRTALVVKMAAKSCPDNWIKEYEGYVMAPGVDSNPGEYICVDKDMREPSGPASFSELSSQGREVREVTISCGALPCEHYKASKPVPCVVCTI